MALTDSGVISVGGINKKPNALNDNNQYGLSTLNDLAEVISELRTKDQETYDICEEIRATLYNLKAVWIVEDETTAGNNVNALKQLDEAVLAYEEHNKSIRKICDDLYRFYEKMRDSSNKSLN